MPSAATIAYNNIIDQAATAFSATNTIPSLPARNLAKANLSSIMRVVGLETRINIISPVAVPFRQLGFFGLGEDVEALNFTLAASNDALGSDDVYGFDSEDAGEGESYQQSRDFQQALADFGETRSAKFFRLDLAAEGGAFLDIGRLFFADVIAFDIEDHTYPFDITPDDTSRVLRMAGGEGHIFERPMFREATIPFAGLSERDLFHRMLVLIDKRTGKRKQVVYRIVPPDAPDLAINTCILGRFTDLGTNQISAYVQRRKTLKLREDG